MNFLCRDYRITRFSGELWSTLLWWLCECGSFKINVVGLLKIARFSGDFLVDTVRMTLKEYLFVQKSISRDTKDRSWVNFGGLRSDGFRTSIVRTLPAYNQYLSWDYCGLLSGEPWWTSLWWFGLCTVRMLFVQKQCLCGELLRNALRWLLVDLALMVYELLPFNWTESSKRMWKDDLQLKV